MQFLVILCLFLFGFSKTTGLNVNGMDKRIYHCPDDFVRLGNSCYFLSKYMDTWHGAQFICKDKKSQLATPNRRIKDKNLRRLLNNRMTAPLERWIGGIYNWEENLWVWGNTGRRIKYQGFSHGTNENSNWHCIAMDPTEMYRWKSESCLLRKHFICEVPLRNIGKKPNDIIKNKRRKQQRKRPLNVNQMDNRIYHCPDEFVRLGKRCYYISSKTNSWHEAQFTCMGKKSHLAKPNTKRKDRKLRNYLQYDITASLDRWIGAIYNGKENIWVWGDTGRRLKYQGFYQRRNESYSWQCTAMDPTLQYHWKSNSCLIRKHFICEVPLWRYNNPNSILI